jgi:class 3 adenylate cyclase
VPEWVAPRRFLHQRLFHSGPLRRTATEILIDPVDDGNGGQRSRVRYRLIVDIRYRALAILLSLGPLYRFGRRLDKLFREEAASVVAGEPAGFHAPPPALSAATRHRLEARMQRLIQRGHGMAARLATHLQDASDTDLERMRPRALARLWGCAGREAIETCLAAAREGLLVLRWDLICPRCRGAKAVAASLDQLPQGAHCHSCNIPFDRDFSRNVEVTFDPAEDIRLIENGVYCLGSPVAAEHIRVQQRIAAGSSARFAVKLPDGLYRARTVEMGGASDFVVEGGVLPQIVLRDGNPVLRAGQNPEQLEAHNDTQLDRTLVIEDRAWAAEALTANEVTTMQAFRDLFADVVLRPGDRVEIRRVALMFTDLKGSSDLYNRVGDALAYGWVREHFAVLARAVRNNNGAVVKTIGDAVMAAFANPVDALAAAVEIRAGITAFNQALTAPTSFGKVAIIVKLGLHCGPCIAVTLNERFDYFGRTINLAARLEGESRGDDIVLSATMAAEPGMAAELERLTARRETARVKGFAEPIDLYRIPPSAFDGASRFLFEEAAG